MQAAGHCLRTGGMSTVQTKGQEYGSRDRGSSCESYADSQWVPPHDFARGVDRFFLPGRRKHHAKGLSRQAGRRGYDKDPASTHVPDEIREDTMRCCASYADKARFPRMFSSIGLPPRDTKFVRLSAGICHGVPWYTENNEKSNLLRTVAQRKIPLSGH